MKLTITTTESGKPPARTVEYDGKPEYHYQRTQEYTPHGETAPIFGCHVVWCYYKAGKRVATVVVSRTNEPRTASADKNRLRRCWPERIEIVITSRSDKDGARCLPPDLEGSKALLRDESGLQAKPLEFVPYWSDEAFVHPDDDASFDGTENLTQEDRDWIAACDKKAPEQRSADTAPKSQTNAPCAVCQWHHAPGQFTSFASGSTRFTLNPNSTAHKALKLVHDFMEKNNGAAMPRNEWNKDGIYDEPAAIFRRHKTAWGMIGVPMHHVQILPPDQYKIVKRPPTPARKSVPRTAAKKRKSRHK